MLATLKQILAKAKEVLVQVGIHGLEKKEGRKYTIVAGGDVLTGRYSVIGYNRVRIIINAGASGKIQLKSRFIANATIYTQVQYEESWEAAGIIFIDQPLYGEDFEAHLYNTSAAAEDFGIIISFLLE